MPLEMLWIRVKNLLAEHSAESSYLLWAMGSILLRQQEIS